MELIDDQTDQYGVHFVKINDKRVAKTYGIVEYPTLTYFRNKEQITFNGDLENGESVLEFLISLQTMADRIEEVFARGGGLDKAVNENTFIAVLFCPSHTACKEKPSRSDCKKCDKALRELENIDDEADELGIAFVKIHDDELADEYNLAANLPALVYYRYKIPIVFEGDLTKGKTIIMDHPVYCITPCTFVV